MHRAIVSSSIGLGVATALLLGCHSPPERLTRYADTFERTVQAPLVPDKPPPMAQPATQAKPSVTESASNELAFYELVETFGLEVSIDLVTGRRTCTDRVNRVIVMPSARSITVNGREHPLDAPIRWRDGVLYVPGQTRAILAANLSSVPIQDVAADPELFDGRELHLGPWRRGEAQPASASRGRGAATSLPTAWQVRSKRQWQFIIIHHSATANGGAQSFGREHQKKWPNGLGYHFVIGNGSDTGDGQVEVGPRWLRQDEGIDGAHAGNERYNKLGIGICLVGDYNTGRPTPAQLVSLRRLCGALMSKYGITRDRIYPHCDVRRGHTDCPGKNFPFQSFLSSM
ncbi:MAG: N-acetylmuramoyl-L-alanine amidase [Planctomycetes bacterium]|nr:N-acetylmuramoyl-L-alanine amidase [Planctomycetota bacterium]